MPALTRPLTRASAAHIRKLLHEKRTREADGTFVVEGAKAVRDVLAEYPSLVQTVVTTPAYCRRELPTDRHLRETSGVFSYTCSSQVFATLSNVRTPQEILAVVKQPVWSESEVLSQDRVLGLFGERIQDPLNLGAIIRTAAALNSTALWLTSDSVDRFNPKVVRATGGALLCLPMFIRPDVAGLSSKGCAVYASDASLREAVEIESIHSIPDRLILVFGNEGQGVSEHTRRAAVVRFSIPIRSSMESLNVSASVAIALHYFGRLPTIAGQSLPSM
ncbi:putative 23S rRNA methyltransferase RlmB [Nitrospira sp. KM1]|uniref:TrmH family RNA methyltransferase n=1 Tax=Nitrospira sp. KM1 TaxID=1936990 RepID=UPI0013A78CB0|nr:RNA methyltransferase [Nitrospira sp. KM1]BCA53963.1 putative 23S rRNA methyltransferase RlmB [Nitrospira sp. KM1]